MSTHPGRTDRVHAASWPPQLGLAIAVLIDAAIIRVILLPARMTLLGERNW